MKGIYLAAFKAIHEYYDIDYQDINGKRDIGGDMLEIDLSHYDFIIATPPCNYWSRANYRRETSKYAQATKHLLPAIIEKLCKQNKPFIIENVQNSRLMHENNLFDFPCYIFKVGRHTYWSNVKIETSDLKQTSEFIPQYKQIGYKQFLNPQTGKVYRSNNTRRISNSTQGGDNVHLVIDRFLHTIGLFLC